MGYLYQQTPSQPDWFHPENGLTASATSGTSSFNEWYLFKDRVAAIKVISRCFSSQSFIDGFGRVGHEYYHMDDLRPIENGEGLVVVGDAKPAGINAMVWAESMF